MKNLFLILALVCATTFSALAQDAGTIHFGDKESPDMVLRPTHPGYAAFVQAVANNSQENSDNISWDAVRDEISSVPGLEGYSDWLGSARVAYGVWQYCCSANGWSCYAHVPYSCSYACGCSKSSNINHNLGQ